MGLLNAVVDSCMLTILCFQNACVHGLSCYIVWNTSCQGQLWRPNRFLMLECCSCGSISFSAELLSGLVHCPCSRCFGLERVFGKMLSHLSTHACMCPRRGLFMWLIKPKLHMFQHVLEDTLKWRALASYECFCLHIRTRIAAQYSAVNLCS